jgi:hypothetical protein
VEGLDVIEQSFPFFVQYFLLLTGDHHLKINGLVLNYCGVKISEEKQERLQSGQFSSCHWNAKIDKPSVSPSSHRLHNKRLTFTLEIKTISEALGTHQL